MRGLNATDFDQRSFTGYRAADEADYPEMVATDVQAIRIKDIGRCVDLCEDIRSFIGLVSEIRTFKPHVIHTHTAKADFLGRIASITSFQTSIRVHTFHGHLLNGYYGLFKRSLVVMAKKILARFTDQKKSCT
jgi:hypothetical protein